MANHKSAIKRHRQSEKRKQRNAAVKSTVRTAVKRVKEDVSAKKITEATDALKEAISLLDSAASKGVLHRNNASRKISRLTSLVNSAKAK